MNRTSFLAAILVGVALSSAAFATPTKLELRVICETPEVAKFRADRQGRTNQPSWAWNASHNVKKHVRGFKYAGPGLVLTVQIDGVRRDLNLDGKSFRVETPDKTWDYRVTGKVAASGAPGVVRFGTVDMKSGAVTIELGDIIDPDPRAPLTVTIWPQNFEGTGLTYDSGRKYYVADMRYRKDNATILPEIVAIPRRGMCGR